MVPAGIGAAGWQGKARLLESMSLKRACAFCICSISMFMFLMFQMCWPHGDPGWELFWVRIGPQHILLVKDDLMGRLSDSVLVCHWTLTVGISLSVGLNNNLIYIGSVRPNSLTYSILMEIFLFHLFRCFPQIMYRVSWRLSTRTMSWSMVMVTWVQSMGPDQMAVETPVAARQRNSG